MAATAGALTAGLLAGLAETEGQEAVLAALVAMVAAEASKAAVELRAAVAVACPAAKGAKAGGQEAERAPWHSMPLRCSR